MKFRCLSVLVALTSALTINLFPLATSMASEMTIPNREDTLSPNLAGQFTYIEDGALSDAVGLPMYQWLPKDKEIRVVFLGIHGLTLHGRRYRVLARTLASQGIAFVAPDMRGFGRCYFDQDNKWGSKKDDKRKINHEKSYQDLVNLATAVKQKYPDKPLVVLGESLGATFCVRLAGEHPELINGMILSAPAVKVNPDMYLSPSDIKAGIAALISMHHELNLHHFITSLVSDRQEVRDEMLDDPLILKKAPLFDLLSTDEFVAKTAAWGKTVPKHLPVLILQGSNDRCVVPDMVTHLTAAMPSDDQTVRWLGSYGHLQLETSFMRSAIIDALGDWFESHSPESRLEIKSLDQKIVEAGGTLVN